MFDIGTKHKIQVVKHRWLWMILSAILLIPGIVALIYSSVTYENHVPLKVGIDYTGGTILQYGVVEKVENKDLTTIREGLDSSDCEEARYFIEHYLNAFEKPLDDITI